MNPNQQNPGPSNTGQFMSPVRPGVGPELAKVMAMQNQGAGSTQNQNSQNPNAVMPASPPPPANGIPAGMAQSGGGAPGMPPQAQDADVLIALKALSQYVGNHAKLKNGREGVK